MYLEVDFKYLNKNWKRNFWFLIFVLYISNALSKTLLRNTDVIYFICPEPNYF